MQILSLQAIFLFYGIFLFSCLLWMSWLFRAHADPSARLWMGATLLTALATSVTAWRASLPVWLGYELPNTLQFAAGLLFCLAVWALKEPLPRLPAVLAGVALSSVLFSGALVALGRWHPEGLVIYVGLVNGVVRLSVMAWLLRRLSLGRGETYLRGLLLVMSAIGVLWLLRLPVFWLGQGAHAMDPQLLNWMIFTGLLGLGIAQQFGYIGVRYAWAYENRLLLARTQSRLAQVVGERNALARLQHAPSAALASRIAHEINQPLAALRLSLESAEKRPFDRLSARELEQLIDDIDRISASVERARDMAHGPQPQLVPVTLAELVAGLSLSIRTLGGRMNVRAEPAGAMLRCDVGLLSAAWTTALQKLLGDRAPDLELLIRETGVARLSLRMRLPADLLSISPDELSSEKGAPTLQRSEALLDLITLDHLARSHAGRFEWRLDPADTASLELELVLPTVQPDPALARAEVAAC